MLIAEGIPVVVSVGLGVFADFGIEGIGGFGCPTVFVGFDLLFGLASLVLSRVSSALERKLAVFAKSLISSKACSMLTLVEPFSITSISFRISSRVLSIATKPFKRMGRHSNFAQTIKHCVCTHHLEGRCC